MVHWLLYKYITLDYIEQFAFISLLASDLLTIPLYSVQSTLHWYVVQCIVYCTMVQCPMCAVYSLLYSAVVQCN